MRGLLLPFTFLALICAIASNGVHATPTHVTAWFLKEPKVVFVPGAGDGWSWGPLTAQNYECVPMGDGCFHPQLGYFDRSAMDVSTRESEKAVDEKASKGEVERAQVKTFNSHETDRIECDKNNIFDVYCGREGRGTGGREGEFEVWLDVSSSLRIIDPDDKGGVCHRKALLDQIVKSCGDKVVFKSYNTSIKEITDTSYACINHGLNDTDRLIKWIENSKAKHLFIVTDISEFSTGLSDYLQSIGAKVHGVDVKDVMAKDLGELGKLVSKVCQ